MLSDSSALTLHFLCLGNLYASSKSLSFIRQIVCYIINHYFVIAASGSDTHHLLAMQIKVKSTGKGWFWLCCRADRWGRVQHQGQASPLQTAVGLH